MPHAVSTTRLFWTFCTRIFCMLLLCAALLWRSNLFLLPMTTVKPRTARDRASARGLTSNNVVLREYSAHLRDALYTDGAFHVYAPDVEALEKQLRARHNASPGALTPTGQPRLVPIGSRTTRYPPPAICTYLAERDAVHEKLLELSAPQLPKPHLSHQWEGVDACPRMWVAETPRGRTLFVQNANGLGRSTQIEPRHAWPYTKIRLIDSAERWSALRGDLALTAEGPRHRRHGADGPSSVVDTIGCRNAPEVASHAFVIGSRYNCVGPMRGSSLSEWLNEVFVPTFYSLRTRHEQGFPRESLFFDNDCTRIQDEGDTWPSGWSLRLIPWQRGAVRTARRGQQDPCGVADAASGRPPSSSRGPHACLGHAAAHSTRLFLFLFLFPCSHCCQAVLHTLPRHSRRAAHLESRP